MKRLVGIVRFGLLAMGGWAPLAVLLLHKVVMLVGLRGQADWLLHSTGGVAIAFCIWKTIPLFGSALGSLTELGRIAFAFAGGCAAAVLWELGEFASDCLLQTNVQRSLNESMLDLAWGVAGAACLAIGAGIAKVRTTISADE